MNEINQSSVLPKKKESKNRFEFDYAYNEESNALAFESRLNTSTNMFELFKTGCHFLEETAPLLQASLAIYDETSDCFTIGLLKKGREYLSGVEFLIDAPDTFLGKALRHGSILTTEKPEKRKISFVESKLLFAPETNTTVIMPLYHNNEFIGTFNIGLKNSNKNNPLEEKHLQKFSTLFSRSLTSHLK